MSEAAMRSEVIKALRSLDAMAVENRVGPGTPDVECIGGWIELKQVSRWPRVTKDGVEPMLRVAHFTPQQRRWLRRRWRHGGGAWMLLQVSHDWLLLSGETAAEIVGRATKSELLSSCVAHWSRHLDRVALLRIVKEGRT